MATSVDLLVKEDVKTSGAPPPCIISSTWVEAQMSRKLAGKKLKYLAEFGPTVVGQWFKINDTKSRTLKWING